MLKILCKFEWLYQLECLHMLMDNIFKLVTIMKKINWISSIIVLLLCLFSCQEDKQAPEETYIPMTISGEVINVSDYGLHDGMIDITISGGKSPFQFHWSNNTSNEDIFDLCCGEYIVKVTDAKSNSVNDTFMISQPEAEPIITEFTIENPSVTGATDGSIILSLAGGYEPFTFRWSNGEHTKNLYNLPADLYIITVEDSRGQIQIDSVRLNDYILTDVDGNTYSMVTIGSQIWMKENLRVTHAPDSTDITSYVYQNNSEYEDTYGRLYSWTTAMNGSTEKEAQGICPCGWHIPSDEEYKLLEIELGMTRTEADLSNTWRGKNVGTKLMAGGSSGFEARLSGRANSSSSFSLMGRMEYYWTSDEYGSKAWRRCLDINADDVGRWNTFPKSYAFSIRCIKNK